MSRASSQDKQNSRTVSNDGTSRGTGHQKQSQALRELSVRSVLIEPRDNEPPRVSISVSYEGEVPGMKALKKMTADVLHDVCRAQTFVDLGERQNVQRGELTKCFSAEASAEAKSEKGGGGG